MINAGDTAWVLMSTALVMLMLPGLALFYGGLVRAKNVLSTIMHSFFGLAIVTVLWVIVGFSLAFGDSIGDLGIVGNPLQYAFFNDVGMEPAEVDKALNKRSGLLGVSDDTNDMRDLLDLVDQGDKKATLAIEMFVYSILKYIGSYTAVLPRVDAIVLTGGIGENSLPVRERLCAGLANLGATEDLDRNHAMSGGKAGPITANGSELPVWVIPTNEELMIARDTRRLVAQG